MPIERWRPGERKPAIPTDNGWNRFADHVDADKLIDLADATRTPYVPFKIKAAIDMPRLAVVGLERPVPNPLGGAVTAFATVESTVTSGTIDLTDAEFVNVTGTPPPLPATIAHPGNDDEFTAGETVALSHDGTAWSLILSGQRGGHLRQPWMLAVPAQAQHAAAFAILQQSARAGLIVNAVVSGVTWARITVTDESHTHAAPPANDPEEESPVFSLQSGTTGAKILWKEPGLGERYGLVLLGGAGGGGTPLVPVVVYDDLPAGSFDSSGKFTPGANVRCLPVADDAGESPNLEAEFINAKWRSASALSLGESGCCGGSGEGSTPTGPRITTPLGPGSINRVKAGETLDLSGTGAVPGEALTASVIAINPTTGSTSGSEVTPTVTNNGDGTWTAAPQSLSTLARGVCRVSITNGSTSHYVLVLNSADEWEPGESNMTGDVYWTGLPARPDLDVASDTGPNQADNVTEDTTPTFAIAWSGSEFIGLKDDVAGNLYVVNQSTGAVTIVAGSAGDFSALLTINKMTGALSLGTYEVFSVLYLTFTNTGYTYDEWWSPPSRGLRVQIVEDTDSVPATPRVCRLGWLTTVGGVNYVTVDACYRELTEDEIEKLDA